MQPEQMLQAIIQKQVDGGYENWKYEDVSDIHGKFGVFRSSNGGYESCLLILLDTEGCKAVYGDEPAAERSIERMEAKKDGVVVETMEWRNYKKLMWAYASDKILEAWNSGEGNNYKKAIETAYNLL